MIRLSTLALFIAVLSALLSGPGSAKTIDLVVFELPVFTGQDIVNRSETAVVRAFLKKYPNIRLRKGTGLKIEGGANTLDMVPLMQIAGDISPNVIYVNFRFSDTYIQSGFLYPLDEYIEEIPKEELDRRVPPSIRPVCYRPGPDGKSHWYSLPTAKLVRVLAWRRDHFMAAGLDPDRPPKTWKELESYSEKLTDYKKNRYGIGFTKGDGTAWDFATLAWSRGGSFFRKMPSGEWKPVFASTEVVDALYFYVRITQKWFTDKNGIRRRGVAGRDGTTGIFLANDPFSMSVTYLDDKMNSFDPQKSGFAPVPYPEGVGKSVSEINARMLGIYAGTKDPEVRRAAFRYMAFKDSDEANRIRVRMFIQSGFGKFVSPDLLERFGYKDYLRQVDKEWIKAYKEAVLHGQPEPYGKNCAMVYREFSRPIDQALNDPIVIGAMDRGDEKAAKARLWQILRSAQAETDKRMYGYLPPKVKALRYFLTQVFLILTLAAFGFTAVYLTKLFRMSAPTTKPGQKNLWLVYILLFPAMASVLVWQYLPLLRGTVMAFQEYNIMKASPFVGLDNFATILFDPAFWHSVKITLTYTILYMASAFLAPIGLALLLSEVPRGKMFFRTVFYLPAVLAGLVVIFLWKSFYKPAGLLNTLLGYLHINVATGWLDSPSLAMAAVLLPVIWSGMGPGCLIYLAALKTIPEEFYEAAEVDGAGIRRKIWHITLPSIRMLIIINSVGAFIGAFMSSDMIFAMTGGGPYTPYGATEVVGLQLFYTAFMYLKFGVANAMGWVLGFMLIGFTIMQLKNLSRVEFKGGR